MWRNFYPHYFSPRFKILKIFFSGGEKLNINMYSPSNIFKYKKKIRVFFHNKNYHKEDAEKNHFFCSDANLIYISSNHISRMTA